MNRRQELWLRLLGVVGFVIALFLLPTVGQRCSGPPAEVQPVQGSLTPATPAGETATAEHTATPTLLPTATPTPMLLPTAVPTPTLLPTAVPTSPDATSFSSPLTSPLPSPTASLPSERSVPLYTYRVIQGYPHDPEAFTQGLVYHEGVLYEGTGLYGRSSLRRTVLETGEVLQSYALPEQFFGEGIAIFQDRIYQLTWKARKGFIYDLQSFDLLDEFSYPTEGWGLTHDGNHLIMSDGTPVLHFLDPATLSEVRRVEVRDYSGPVSRLNELEFVQGEVYANVWQTDRIARVDPVDGRVTGWIDLGGLLPEADRTDAVDVLNGIAYDAQGERLFVTGKLWPKLFEIVLVPQGE